MTVDTAIEILTVRKTCMECVMGNGSCEDCDHAFDMAIESLKHTPCYLDSPCEYQNKDIKIPHTDCIVWHPYPQEKPSGEEFSMKCYLVTWSGWRETPMIDIGWHDEFGWHKNHIEANRIDGVTAWAELPEPYEEGAE